MDNFTEENMEYEYDAHITFMQVGSSGNDGSLLFSGYDNKSVTNDQNNSFPSSLDNEPQMVIEEHKIKQLRQQNTVSDDLEDDSKIEIYDQIGQIKKNIVSVATENTNLLTRRTENDSLNVKTFSIQKNNSRSR